MQGLLSISRVIDTVNTYIGKAASWLILVAVVISAGNAVIRKVFSSSSNAWLEAQWYLFGAVFMLCAAWTLLANEHIRIDVVNSLFPKRVRNWIDIVGHTLFLLPFCILLLYDSWPFFLKSYLQNEQSMNAGGLVVWPAKFLVVAGFVLLFFQGISELIKRIAIMRGELEDVHGGGHHEMAEAEAARLLEVAKAQGLLDAAKK
ncbi:TRAP transporter small permease subunit [Phreatobacter cathodiphilus]|uniref:TRAP transporter small permease protein n=1 Tax=Phreatobacter cathodiphilus TaxID=1868589 RepID=A0A2S0N7W7_9HYPH|nr:TRAP transporter small permease subunit [Phreatobacter cathodiphilus]AVO44270.1 C4-dicarboxylate ABC transporter [Phreatobacter cathodiphilus]